MIKLGIHAFVWNGTWTTETGNQAIRATAREGFDLIEIPLLDPDTFDAASHRRTLQEEQLEATCSLVLPAPLHLPSNPSGAQDFLLRALDKVEAVGSHYLGGCIGYSLGTLTGQPPTAAERQAVIDVLGAVAASAQTRGVTLALEACNRYETYMYNTLEDTRATILAVGAPNLKLHADTYHMNIEENGFITPFERSADVLDYVHMSESHRGLVGSGTVNWDQVWEGLRRANFSGYLALESFAEINPQLAAATCLWRSPQHDSLTLAREGVAFLREGAKRAGLQLSKG